MLQNYKNITHISVQVNLFYMMCIFLVLWQEAVESRAENQNQEQD